MSDRDFLKLERIKRWIDAINSPPSSTASLHENAEAMWRTQIEHDIGKIPTDSEFQDVLMDFLCDAIRAGAFGGDEWQPWRTRLASDPGSLQAVNLLSAYAPPEHRRPEIQPGDKIGDMIVAVLAPLIASSSTTVSAAPQPVEAKPLRGKALTAAKYIRMNPSGVNAKQIAAHIGDSYTEASVRNHLAPKLKSHGFRSEEGPDGGYLPPAS